MASRNYDKSAVSTNPLNSTVPVMEAVCLGGRETQRGIDAGRQGGEMLRAASSLGERREAGGVEEV